MLEHQAKLFYYATRKFYSLQVRITKAIKERGGDSLPNDGEIAATRDVVRRIETEAERLQLSRVLERLWEFHIDSESLQPLDGSAVTLQHLHFQLGKLHKDIQRVLSPGQNRFILIPGEAAKYYNNTELFGPEVAARFPKANTEITEAGNCYATGNYTACVFHLMRAVEHGARVLVKAVGIKRADLRHPIELSDWGALFNALNDALSKLRSRKSVGKSETHAFYSHAVAQFGNFKDAWRNKVSHTRVVYKEPQAMDVMINVRQFMQHISARLKEK
jgi:hypothetical protein